MGDIDFSDEALASRVEGAGEEVVEAAPVEPVVEEVPVEEPAEEPAVEEVPVEDADAQEVPVEESVTTEWQSRYEEAQKLIGRQGQELGELRKAFEELQSQQAQPAPEPEYEQPVFQGRQPQTENDLLDMAATPEEAVNAYRFAAQYAPELLPDVLAEVGAHDPGLAKRMEMDIYSQMIQQSVAPVQESMQRSTQDRVIASTVDQYGASVDGWEDMKAEVAAIIEEEPWLVGDASPEAVQRGLRAATKMAQQARLVAQQHAQAQVAQQTQAHSQQQRQQAVVETGTAGAAPVVEDKSVADSIRDGIFAEDKKRRELFS